jgi:UDP-glucose 4-epimerase
VVKAFEQVTGMALNYRIVDRRPGDVTAVYADTRKANEVLGWKTVHSLEEALDSAWRWEQRIRNL